MTFGRGLVRSSATAVAVVQPWLLAPASAAGGLGGGEPLEVSLGRIVAALLISLIVAGLAVFAIRQRGGRIDLGRLRLPARAASIEVVETRRVSQHADICLIRHRGNEYLLLLMAGDARVLSEAVASSPNPEAGTR